MWYNVGQLTRKEGEWSEREVNERKKKLEAERAKALKENKKGKMK